MARTATDIPKKNNLKIDPPRRNSTDDSVIQISKPKATTRNHIKASSYSYRPTSTTPKKNEPKPGPLSTYLFGPKDIEPKCSPLRRYLICPEKFNPKPGPLSTYLFGPKNIEPKHSPLKRYSIGPEKFNPKPSPLRSTSIGPEKNEQKPGPLRRYSTGNPGIKLSEPKPTPNYLKAFNSSCHDVCKYGIKYEFHTRSWAPPPLPRKHDRNVKISREEKSAEHYNGKKVLPSAVKQPLGTKNTSTHQPSFRQPHKTFLKRATDVQNSKASIGSSVKVPIARTSVKKTSYEDVPEKIIHVIEPKHENQSTFSTSSSNENKKMTNATTRDRRLVIPNERDYSYPRKLKFWRGKVLEMQNGNDGYMEKTSLRRVICEGKFVRTNDGFIRAVLRRQGIQTRNSHMALMNTVIEETATKLVQMRKSKVEALVGAFECVINLQDTESSTSSSSTTL